MTFNLKTILQTVGLITAVAVPLVLAVHGLPGNITESDMIGASWIGGPFESSVERGRFALTFSLAENRTVHFSANLARFAVPDLGYINGSYVSLFAPAVSYLAIPGYLLGKMFSLSQVGAFLTSSLFGFINFWLIYSLSIKLGIRRTAGLIGAVVFLFATPAFAYSTTLYQHHISTFLVLAGLWLAISFNSFWSFSLIWGLCAASILVDYPNLFLMLPLGVFALVRLLSVHISPTHIRFNLSPRRLLSLWTILVPLGLFLWFNQASYNNPLQFSGTVDSVREIGPNGLPASVPSSSAPQSTADTFSSPPPPTPKKSAINFFHPRNLIRGLYTHLISPDRGILVFTPIVLLGAVGLFHLPAASVHLTQLLLATVGFNLVLYSMWGDPWGGWAFGSRYLIPAYAVCSLGLAAILDRWRKSALAPVVFQALFVYSLAVSTLGAVGLVGIPPEIETGALSAVSGRHERSSFDRSAELILANRSKSFIYQAHLSRILPAWNYYLLVMALPAGLGTYLLYRLSHTHGR